MHAPHPQPADPERADAARNRLLLLDAARRLVGECGAAHVTMQAVAREAGVGKGTLFRRFGDRDGLLLALLEEAEADFHDAFTHGPPPLGPGAPPTLRLTAFGHALIDRALDETDLGAALSRQLLPCHRHASRTAHAFQRHVSTLLREAGVDGDHELLAHALLAFTSFETLDHLSRTSGLPVAFLRATWTDLVRRVARPERELG